MTKVIERFWGDETGNAVVDWLVLGAGVLMLATALIATVSPLPSTLASDAAAAPATASEV